MKPVLYRYRDSESVIKPMEGYTPGEGWTPLYDQAALDAAVAAEREWCAQAVLDLDKEKWFPSQRDFAEASVDAIRKGE